MATFLFAFAFFMVVMLGMALGVILRGKTIKGSCGGLNAVSGADRCVVCHKEIDPDSPLRERLSCPRADGRAEMGAGRLNRVAEE